MSDFSIIRPNDDAAAQQSYDWGEELLNKLTASHSLVDDVDDTTPADSTNIAAALQNSNVSLVCYFGHGDESNLQTNGVATVDDATIKVKAGIAIVAVACKTAVKLGSAAITAGADAWLGFDISLPIITPHKNIDPIGDAIVNGLADLENSCTMQQAHSDLWDELDDVVRQYDVTGPNNTHPHRWMIYYGAMAARDHIVLHGSPNCTPL